MHCYQVYLSVDGQDEKALQLEKFRLNFSSCFRVPQKKESIIIAEVCFLFAMNVISSFICSKIMLCLGLVAHTNFTIVWTKNP